MSLCTRANAWSHARSQERYRQRKDEERKAAKLAELKAILAAPEKDPRELAERFQDPAERLAYARIGVGPRHRWAKDRPLFCRGIGAGLKLLGCDYQTARILLSFQSPYPGYDAAFARLPRACPANQIGTVYTVESPACPGVVKIGFTVNLDRRLRELCREYRTDLVVRDAKVGTYVDEYALHRLLIDGEVHREWFSLRERGANPDFLRAARGNTVEENTEKYLRLFSGHDAGQGVSP